MPDLFSGALKRRERVPGRAAPSKSRVWVTTYECVRCKLFAVHVEAASADEEPHGLPPERAVCECGSLLVAIVPPR